MMRRIGLHRKPLHAQQGGHAVVMVVQLHGSAGGWGLGHQPGGRGLGVEVGAPLQGMTPMPRREPEAALLSRSVPARSAVPLLHVLWTNRHLYPPQELAARTASFSPADLRHGQATSARNHISPATEPEASVLRSTLRSGEGPIVSARPAWRKVGQGHRKVRLFGGAKPCQVLRLCRYGSRSSCQTVLSCITLVSPPAASEDQLLLPCFLQMLGFPEDMNNGSQANMPAVGSAHVATGCRVACRAFRKAPLRRPLPDVGQLPWTHGGPPSFCECICLRNGSLCLHCTCFAIEAGRLGRHAGGELCRVYATRMAR